MERHGLVHGDFKWDNMGYSRDHRFLLTDFGLSSQGGARVNLEFFVLVRSLLMIEDQTNRDFFRKAFLPVFRTEFSAHPTPKELISWGEQLFQCEFYGTAEVAAASRTRRKPIWGSGGIAGGYSRIYDEAVEKFSAALTPKLRTP